MAQEASPGYAYGQLERALRTASSTEDDAVRRRAHAKAGRWQADGRLPNGGRRLLGWTTGPHWCR